ncbi:MAG: NAD-dependent deacylase [Bacteroidales bacterium]|jgi:NAD-dependent deacetylase|nr:NAD-dependent deacylase [Bacteroidales bacterium]
MKRLVIFSGAGISKESGIPTFRDIDGLWNKYDFTELATFNAWKKNPELVLDFYNFRRRNVLESNPNKAHSLIKEFENYYEVKIITQNVDDLHERAGSKDILHLHGEIRKARSTADDSYITDIKGIELNIGDMCPKGSQLRPHIVWFGESVPNLPKAIEIAKTADIFIVIGTGLQVYPAANLINYVPSKAKKYIIDPSQNININDDFIYILDTATNGMNQIYNELIR